MEPYKSEKVLSYCYPLIIAFGFICSVTSAVAWNHWKYVLDTCVESNCGCILNGVSTITYFTGSHIAYCHYATFGLLLSMLVAFIFGSYHVFRMCIASGNRHRVSKHSVRQRSGEVIVMTARSEVDNDEVSPHYWVPAAIASGVMVLYTLIHAVIFVDGAWQSCRQYRNELVKYMHATGPLVAAVQGRLSCTAVFDFMDYLHPDVSYDRRRFDRIDTSWCLFLAGLSTVATLVLWCTVFMINVSQARRSSRLRVNAINSVEQKLHGSVHAFVDK